MSLYSIKAQGRHKAMPGDYFVTLTALGLQAVRDGAMFADWPVHAPDLLFFGCEKLANSYAVASGFGDGEYAIKRVPKSHKQSRAVDDAQYVLECFLG